MSKPIKREPLPKRYFRVSGLLDELESVGEDLEKVALQCKNKACSPARRHKLVLKACSLSERHHDLLLQIRSVDPEFFELIAAEYQRCREEEEKILGQA